MNAQWTFLTNHTHVLICLARDADMRVRDVAELVGITERAVLRIISELSEDGYITIVKEGRRNSYQLNRDKQFRHPVESGHTIGSLLAALEPTIQE